MQVIVNLNFQPANASLRKFPLYKVNISRKKLYWLCQIIGWGTFVLVNFLIISSFEELRWERIISGTSYLIAGIGFTHIFRGIIKKRNWLGLPLKKIVPNVIFSIILLGVTIYGVMYSVSFFSGTMVKQDYTVIRPIIGLINTTGISLLWALIYFSIHYLENYKKTEIESLIWEAAVKDYELKTLKTQLNRMFYNVKIHLQIQKQFQFQSYRLCLV